MATTTLDFLLSLTTESYGYTDPADYTQSSYGIENTTRGGLTNITSSLKIQLQLYDILIPLLGVFIIATNFAIVISSGLLIKKGQQPRCTYLLLGNVAMADLVTGIGVVFGQAFPKSKRNHLSCCFMLGLIVSSTLTSVYSVALIAIDRFLYIIHGLKYQKWVYPTRVRCMIAATWILGIVIGFLPAMGWNGDTQNGKICWFIMLAPPELIILTTVIGFIPIVLVCVLYSIILYHAIKKVIQLRTMGKINQDKPTKLRAFKGGRQKNTREENHAEVQIENQNKFTKFISRLKSNKNLPNIEDTQPNNPTKWKAIKVVLYTTGSFIITWAPYFLASTMYVFCDPAVTPEKCQKLKYAIASPLAILGFLNSLLNPIIYAWWHNGFRKSIKRICCRWRRNEEFNPNQPKHSDTTRSCQTISSQIHNSTSDNTAETGDTDIK